MKEEYLREAPPTRSFAQRPCNRGFELQHEDDWHAFLDHFCRMRTMREDLQARMPRASFPPQFNGSGCSNLSDRCPPKATIVALGSHLDAVGCGTVPVQRTTWMSISYPT